MNEQQMNQMYHTGINTDDYNRIQTEVESDPGSGLNPGIVVISEKAIHDQT